MHVECRPSSAGQALRAALDAIARISGKLQVAIVRLAVLLLAEGEGWGETVGTSDIEYAVLFR